MSFPSEKRINDETISAEDDQIRRVQLKIQFHGTKKGDLETIESYVKKLKSIADSLEAIGNPISDPDLVLQLLAGLPLEYSPYQNTISSQIPLPDFPEACSLLYMYETLLQEQKPNPTGASDDPSEDGIFNKETFTKILDALNTVGGVVSMVGEIRSMFGTSSSTTKMAAAAASAANAGNKKYTRRPNGGRGNYNRRGPPAGGYRSSGRK